MGSILEISLFCFVFRVVKGFIHCFLAFRGIVKKPEVLWSLVFYIQSIFSFVFSFGSLVSSLFAEISQQNSLV